AAITPVKLAPQPNGKWRWIGTRTILFDPEVRFPQATTYHVEVPAGTRSATGNPLAKPVAFTFETPAPTIVTTSPSPYEPQRLDVPMFVLFDQKIDPRAVLRSIHVTAHAGVANDEVVVRMLDAKELEQDHALAALVAATKQDEKDGRWLAFRAVAKLPADAQIEVAIAPGTPSAEGPNLTKQRQAFSFHTFPPLRVDRMHCNWGAECPPGAPYVVEFDNPLDEDKFDDQLVTVTPALA